mgnify:CR=1 FL=1
MEPRKVTDSNAKARQRTDTENRCLAYSDFHRTLGRHLLATDVDNVEWRFRNGDLRAVGVMEITRIDGDQKIGKPYLDAILERFTERDTFQSKAALTVAAALKTHVYIVLYRADCTEFWVYRLSDGHGFNNPLTAADYEKFLEAL